MEIIEFIRQPWPWWVGGPVITVIMVMLLYFGQEFGISSTLRTVCSATGGGKVSSFFKFNWRDEVWNLVFAAGALIGGIIASTWLMEPNPINLNPETVQRLSTYGVENAGEGYLPSAIFSWEGMMTTKGAIMILLGGFLVGFGTRYAGGCTSGHAISGLSNLQMPSLIAVIGFFIGGLFVTFLVLPYLLTL